MAEPCLPVQTIVPCATMSQTWFLRKMPQQSSSAGSCCADCSRSMQDHLETHLPLHDMEQQLRNTCPCLLPALMAVTVTRTTFTPAHPCRTWSSSSAMPVPASLS